MLESRYLSAQRISGIGSLIALLLIPWSFAEAPGLPGPCPCTASIDENVDQNGECAIYGFTEVSKTSGECDFTTVCVQASTQTQCEFSFDVTIVAKTGELAECCETVTYSYLPRICAVNTTGDIVPGSCILGNPIPVTRPFVQMVRDFTIDCGKSVGWKITEKCGENSKVLSDVDLICALCSS